MTYKPQPGTQAFRILAWLASEGKTAERNTSQIANAMGIETNGVPTLLAPALAAHLVFRRQKDRTHPRAPFWYSLTDHGVHQRLFTSKPAEWMQRPKINRKDAEESGSSPGTPGASGTPEVSSASSAEAAAADAPSGDEGAAADADRAAAPAPDTSAPGSQQVLKEEAARPDATARETPDTASPGVGPMGAGQPADAGPTGDEMDRELRAASKRAIAAGQGLDAALDDAAKTIESRHVRHDEQPREVVDAQFAASLRAAMDVCKQMDDDARKALVADIEKDMKLPPADLAATRRAAHYVEHGGKRYCDECGQREGLSHGDGCSRAFRAARFTDGSLATERDGVVVAVYSRAEVDEIQKLLGVRT